MPWMIVWTWPPAPRSNAWDALPSSITTLASTTLGSGGGVELPNRLNLLFLYCMRLLARALDISRRCMQTAGVYQSERQRIVQMMVMRNHLDLYLSLPVTQRTQGSAIYPDILAWKGVIAARQWRDRQYADAETAPLDAELRQVRRRLATLKLRVPEPAARGEWIGEIFQLTMRKEALEQQRSLKSSKVQPVESVVRTAELQSVLPAQGALIDFVLYPHTRFENENGTLQMKRRERYLALVVRRDREVVRIDLGEAGPIWEAVSKWRKTHGFRPDPGQTDWAAAVHQLLWPRLKPLVDDCDTLLISPDGVLSQMAWSVLPGRTPERYLLEDFAIAMVPVPQLLPELLSGRSATAAEQPAPPLAAACRRCGLQRSAGCGCGEAGFVRGRSACPGAEFHAFLPPEGDGRRGPGFATAIPTTVSRGPGDDAC